MRIAMLGMYLLSLVWCLSVDSGLAAQPALPPPGKPANAEVFEIGDVRVPPLNEEQLRQVLFTPAQIDQILQKAQQHPAREAQQKSAANLEWLRWLSYALAALGGVVCSCGAKQVLTKKSLPAAEAPKPRVEPIGIGADGRGGVWLREIPPWEK
jgi:hypothetical protein